MNKNLFCSMQRKLIPSQQAVDQLKERLVQSAPAGQQPIPWKYGALAACAALLIAAYPIYHTLSPTLHPVLDGGQGGYGTYEIATEDAYGEIGTELPRLNIWDTQAPSQASAHSYAAGEGVNREVTQSDLETLLGGFIPQVLGWEGFDQLSGMLAFGPGHGAPLDTLFYGHFYADCDWGKLTLMVGGLGTKVSPDAIGRPEGYSGDALTVIEGIEVLAARFPDLDGTNYGEVSFTTRDGYSVFYAVNTPSPEQTEELLARLGSGEVKEVIMAMNPTVEGEATAMYLAKLIKPLGIKTTRLAYGLPVGASLEYTDETTLYRALSGRGEL